MFAGNDFIAISSLGGTPDNFWLRFLKGRSRLYIYVQLTLYLCLGVIRIFLFGWDFHTGSDILGVLGQNDPQKVKWVKNTCWEGTYLRQMASFEPLSVKLSLSVWPVQVRKKKSRKKRHNWKKCIFHVCLERPLACGFQPNLVNVFVLPT